MKSLLLKSVLLVGGVVVAVAGLAGTASAHHGHGCFPVSHCHYPAYAPSYYAPSYCAPSYCAPTWYRPCGPTWYGGHCHP